MRRVVGWTLLVVFIASPTVLSAGVTGKKKSGVKGRYLELEDGVDLAAYRGAIVILDEAEISADKDKPVDNEAVRSTSDQMLREKLAQVRGLGRIVAEPPLDLPEGTPVLRLKTTLTLQHGSQAMRFFVGAGAGKSKLHIRIDLVDARSGEQLGFFNGYGTGAGFWSISGGGVQRMARDDLEENYQKLAEYLIEEGL